MTGQRIVLATWGSLGDLHPYLALGCELRSRGHHPRIATMRLHEETVREAGLDFAPIRPDVRIDDALLVARLMDGARGPRRLFTEVLIPAIEAQRKDVEAALDDADAVVTHPAVPVAPIVARARALPWISSVLAPLSFLSWRDPASLPGLPSALLRRIPALARLGNGVARALTRSWVAPIDAMRRSHGLRDDGHPIFEGQHSPRLTLALFSSLLAAPQRDWPPNTVQTGFLFYDGMHEHRRSSDELRAFLAHGDPPLVFTLGSSAVFSAGTFFLESARAAQRLGRRAVLVVGRDPASVPPNLPPAILAVPVAPYSELFARAAAIVHQGGIGTTAEALRAGVPMVVMPFSHDQPDNADRVVRLGAGRSISRRRYRATHVAHMLAALLDDARTIAAAKAAGERIRGERGVQIAADAIERAIPRVPWRADECNSTAKGG
ncbi:MAG: glycosyltransferase family 1 protein [Candidatus Eremiobacteraeota bacterium]|nr:glycosyltransferase family 1 protein [Candidatus Eremiobacteraeota bacterium]